MDSTEVAEMRENFFARMSTDGSPATLRATRITETVLQGAESEDLSLNLQNFGLRALQASPHLSHLRACMLPVRRF